jgi:hypothetical protein
MTRPGSQPSLVECCAVLAAVKTASRRHGGGQRPVLTATPRGALGGCRPGRRNGSLTEQRNVRSDHDGIRKRGLPAGSRLIHEHVDTSKAKELT